MDRIGGNMMQAGGYMDIAGGQNFRPNQEMPMNGMEQSQKVQDVDKMKDGPEQMRRPEDMQGQPGIPQQDRTEMSDEAQGIGGAQAAAQGSQVGGIQGMQQDATQQIKDTVTQIIEEAKAQGPGQQGKNQETNTKVEQLKQQLNQAKQNQTPVDPTVKQAADKVIQGDIKTAEKILNQQQGQQGQEQGMNGMQGMQGMQGMPEMNGMSHANQIVKGIEEMQGAQMQGMPQQQMMPQMMQQMPGM